MARHRFLVAPVGEVAKLCDSADKHSGDYQVVQMLDMGGDKVGLLFKSTATANPEADGSYFADYAGNPSNAFDDAGGGT